MSVNLPERQKKLRFAQNLALTGYFSLLIILMLNIVWLIPSRHFPTALVLLLIVGPLLIPMRDLLNSKTYTYQWTSFLSLAYFAHGISEISAYPDSWYAGLLETLASIALYLGCVMYARIFKQEIIQKAQQEAPNKEK
ncbi:MAG: DUF2069 domain-containing protein [Gammaproteobacteria bacterium]|nr:DUF2069 domain-containing protein [Gammaproteobacteria bacterium]